MSLINKSKLKNVSLNEWTVVPDQLLIRGKKGEAKVPAKVMDVLLLLISAKTKTVAREEFIESIWHSQPEVGEKALNQTIWQLRKAFSQTGAEQDVILTVAKTGYRLDEDLFSEPVKNVKTAHWSLKHTIFIMLAIFILPILYFQLAHLMAEEGSSSVTQRPTNLSYFKGAEENPAFTTDGKKMAFQWDNGVNVPGIYYIDLTKKNSVPIAVSELDEHAVSPTWSPDGEAVAYMVSNDEHCKIIIKHLKTETRQQLSPCYAGNLTTTLSWSRIGNQLAYARQNDKGGVNLHSVDMDTGLDSEISIAQGKFHDFPFAWANTSSAIAYASRQDPLGNIYLRDKNGKTRPLLKEEREIFSLAWSPNDTYLYFVTIWQSELAILRITLSDGTVTPVSYENIPGRIAVRLGEQPQLVYPRYTSMEQLYQIMPSGNIAAMPFSYGRDLYPAYSKSQEKIIFFSNKGGFFQLWSATLNEKFAHKFTRLDGSPYIHAISHKGDRFVIPMQDKKDNPYQLYLGNVADGKLTQLKFLDYATKNFSWSQDDQSLIYSANLNGSWQIWQQNLQSGITEQLTLDGGIFAQQYKDGRIFYVKADSNGIWLLDDSAKQPLIADLQPKDWGNWQLTEQGVIYLSRTDSADEIRQFSWQGEDRILHSLPPRSVKDDRSIAMMPDGSIIASMYLGKEADIVAVDLNDDN